MIGRRRFDAAVGDVTPTYDPSSLLPVGRAYAPDARSVDHFGTSYAKVDT